MLENKLLSYEREVDVIRQAYYLSNPFSIIRESKALVTRFQ
jgi:hypothetical protein